MRRFSPSALVLLAAALVLWAMPANATRSATVVKVTIAKPSEFKFTVAPKAVKAGTVTFQVTGGGALPHNFKINGKATKLLTSGQSQNLTVTFAKPGKYPYLCTVTGHAAAGMRGTLTVT
jgi:uncharacterized cupredoxin-like copper-binding protein